VQPLKNHSCRHLVRVCEPTYSTSSLNANGVTVHEMAFPDGQNPPSSVLNKWLDQLEEVEKAQKASGDTDAIAVHCVAGLGRAPVMVAIALIERGMKPLDAIDFVRAKRKGAFNNKQIEFLDSYKKRSSKGMSISKSLGKIFRRSTIDSPTAGSSSSSTVAQGSH